MTKATSMTRGHLTDEQFTACVIEGAPPAACREHLAQCEACRREVGTFVEATGDFSAAALAWSEAQPATSLRGVAGSRTRGHAPLGWAVAAGLAVAVSVPLWNHEHRSPVSSAAAAAAEVPEAEIAQDNRLLEAVDLALAAPEPSPFREYGLQATPETGARARAESRSQ
jgi:predicted anti-sigma-YlaC factor YlaD